MYAMYNVQRTQKISCLPLDKVEDFIRLVGNVTNMSLTCNLDSTITP